MTSFWNIAVLLRFVCTRWSQPADRTPSLSHKLFSTRKKDQTFFFPCCLLVQISMLMTSEYPIVHSDEHVTSFCLSVFGGSQEKRQDSPIAQIALFVFPTLIAETVNT